MSWRARRRRRRIVAAQRRVDRAQVALDIATAHRNRLDPPAWRTRQRRVLLLDDPFTDPQGVADPEEWGPLG